MVFFWFQGSNGESLDDTKPSDGSKDGQLVEIPLEHLQSQPDSLLSTLYECQQDQKGVDNSKYDPVSVLLGASSLSSTFCTEMAALVNKSYLALYNRSFGHSEGLFVDLPPSVSVKDAIEVLEYLNLDLVDQQGDAFFAPLGARMMVKFHLDNPIAVQELVEGVLCDMQKHGCRKLTIFFHEVITPCGVFLSHMKKSAKSRKSGVFAWKELVASPSDFRSLVVSSLGLHGLHAKWVSGRHGRNVKLYVELKNIDIDHDRTKKIWDAINAKEQQCFERLFMDVQKKLQSSPELNFTRRYERSQVDPFRPDKMSNDGFRCLSDADFLARYKHHIESKEMLRCQVEKREGEYIAITVTVPVELMYKGNAIQEWEE